MEQNPREANIRPGSQEITRLLWNLKLHYRVQNSPRMAPIPSQINPQKYIYICRDQARDGKASILSLYSLFPVIKNYFVFVLS
jgi:hypothetical protein